MVVLRAVIEEGADDRTVSSASELEQVIVDAAVHARNRGVLNIVSLYAPTGDNLSIVVGGDESVVGFNYGHGDPPYYASRGRTAEAEPVLTAYVGLAHHTEFPRFWVIPMDLGSDAAVEFLQTGQRPECIAWVEV
jgi:hypothetical protein